MNATKSVISLFLLVTYSMGFAHDLIPHCHYSSDQILSDTSNWHRHGSHDASVNEEMNHHHLSYENHLDEGLLDFAICMLGELEHSKKESQKQYFPPLVNPDLVKSFNQIEWVAILTVLFSDQCASESFFSFPTELTNSYNSPKLENSPLRGPPIYS